MDANRPVPGPAGSFGGLGAGSIVSRNIQPLLDADPRQIGPYAIHGRLGQGAMGHVFLGFAANGPAYALKVLRPDFAADRDFRRRFTREIAAARAVHSPFVNAVTDADPTAATPWLASYFIPGPPLSSAVQLAGPFTPRSVAHLCVGIGLALQAIHTAGIVHRDLKPANVLVASDGPRVIDFGIARAVDASMLTSTGMRLGTPSFMAPEQVAGSDVGAPADVWAVGGMLVYAATGRTAFGDGNAMSILYRVEHHDPNLEGLEPALAHIARACLAKDPAARPTPAQLVEMCRAALDGGGMGIPALPGTDVTGWLPPAVSRDLASRQVELASIRQTQGPAAGVAPGAPAVGGGAATIPGGSKGGGLGGFLRRKGGGQGQGQQPATAPTGVPGQTAGPWTQGAATGTPAGQTGGGQYGAAMSSTGGQYGPGSTGGAGQGPGGAGQSPGQPGPDGTGGGQPVWGTAGQSAAPGTPGTQPPQPVWGTAPSQAPQPVWGTAGPAPAPGNAQPAWGAAGQTPAPGQPPQPVWGTADQAPASSNAQPAWGAAPAAPSGQTPQPVWGTAGQAPASGQPASDNPQPAWGTASQSAAPGQAPQPVWGQNPAPAQGPAPDGPAWGPSGPSGSDMPTIVAPLSSPTPADPQAPAWVSASAANAAAPSEADQPVAPSNPWDDEPHTPAVAGLPPGFTPIGQEAKKLAEVAETPEPAESEPAEPGRASAGPAATAESAASAESAEPDQPAEPDSPAADAESPALADVDAAFGPAKPALSGPGIPSIAPPTFATEFNIPAVKPDAAEPEAKAASIGVPQIAPPTFATEFNIPAVKPSDSAPESDDTATAPPASSSVGIPSIAPPTFATEFNIPAVTPNDPAPDSENAAPAAAAAPASSSIGVPSIAPPTFATEFNIPAVKPADPAPESDDAAPAASTAASSTPAASTAPAWTPGASTPSPASSSSQSAAPTAPSPSPSVGIPSIAPPTFATEFNIPAVTPNDSALDATAPTPKPTIDVPSIAPPTFATEFNIPAVTPNDSALDETAQTAKPAVSVPSIADPAWATGFGIPDPALPADDAPSDSDLASTARTDTGPTPDAWSPAPPTAPATPPPAADTPPPASPIQHAPPIPPHLQQPMTPPKSFTAHSSAPAYQPPAAPQTPPQPAPSFPPNPQHSPLSPQGAYHAAPPQPATPFAAQPPHPAAPPQPATPYTAHPPQTAATPPSHMTVVPPPPSMASPYGAPERPALAPDRSYPAGPKPTLVDTDTPGLSRNKRIAVIVGAAVVVVAGVGGTILALSGGGDSPKPAPTTAAPPADGGSSTSAPASQSSTSASASQAPAGPIGGAQGEEGAKDVVLRGLYAAAADRDFKTVCTSQTTAAQKGAAKGAGWDGKGDPLPMCEKYFTDNWSTIDAAYLRGRKVTEAKAGANATTMLVTVDDAPPAGSAATRTFTVVWSNNHWLLEAAKA